MDKRINPYDKIALFYNILFAFPNHFDSDLVDELDKIFRRREVGSILDCGCGAGNPSIGLALRDYRVIGLDTSESMLKVAQKNAMRVGAKLNFVHLAMESIELLSNFDCIVCHDCLYHFKTREQLHQFLRLVRKKLNYGGCVYIATKVWNNVKDEEARELSENRGIIYLLDKQLEVVDVCMNNVLTVCLTARSEENIESESISFPWFSYSPIYISSALRAVGFNTADQVLEEQEAKYNCAGIIAY